MMAGARGKDDDDMTTQDDGTEESKEQGARARGKGLGWRARGGREEDEDGGWSV